MQFMTPFLPFLSLHLPPHFLHRSLASKMTSFFLPFFPPWSVSLPSSSSAPSIRFFCPFSLFSSSKSHYFVNFVARRCQRDLICKSHCTELIPNLSQCSDGLHSNSFPIKLFTMPPCFHLCLILFLSLWITGLFFMIIHLCGYMPYIIVCKVLFYLCDQRRQSKGNKSCGLSFCSLMKV